MGIGVGASVGVGTVIGKVREGVWFRVEGVNGVGVRVGGSVKVK